MTDAAVTKEDLEGRLSTLRSAQAEGQRELADLSANLLRIEGSIMECERFLALLEGLEDAPPDPGFNLGAIVDPEEEEVLPLRVVYDETPVDSRDFDAVGLTEE